MSRQAETLRAKSASPIPAAVLQRKCACGQHTGGGECEECGKRERRLQRKEASGIEPSGVPPIVHEVLRSPGQPLDRETRAFMEPRFGYDFSGVRVHADTQAAASARVIDALAYTVGKDLVFGADQYSPRAVQGKRLLAHELAHIVQGADDLEARPLRISAAGDPSEREADKIANAVLKDEGSSGWEPPKPARRSHPRIQRTPANKVSCGRSAPLNVPGAPPLVIADPVAVITAAEERAGEVLDQAIGSLEFTRDRIVGGAPIGWPTISDSLAQAIQLMGLDPDSDRFWQGNGLNTAGLLLRRLRAVRRTIGAGSFFFTCLGPPVGNIGVCSGSICQGANAASCAGSFRVAFCRGFWESGAEAQAETLLHESFHNFAFFIQDRGREGNAGCYSRFAQVAAGVDQGFQRVDLCPDP